MFLILNTFSIIVAQRTRELALMRAIGANRRQVIGSVLLEAVHHRAGRLGARPGGRRRRRGAAGQGVLELRAAGSSWPASAVPPAAWISAFAVGLGVTMLAALIPALRASRIPPVAAMREAATPDRPLTRLTVIGGVVFAVGAAALGLGLTDNAGDNELWAILGGVLLAFVGTALLTPLVARPVSAG